MSDKPTAAPNYFPYAHRNMAEVMEAERKAILRKQTARFNLLKWSEMAGLDGTA